MSTARKLGLWLAVYGLAPLGLLVTFYLVQPYRARLSVRWMVFYLAVLLALEGWVWLEYRYMLQPLWKTLSRPARWLWGAASAVFAVLLFVYAAPDMNAVMEKFPQLAPWERLEVRPALASSGSRLEIASIRIGNTLIGASELQLAGAWQKEGNRLWTEDPDAVAVVEGRIPQTVRIMFGRSASAGPVQVQWDGKSQVIDLQSQKTSDAAFTFRFDTSQRQEPAVSRWIRFLTLPGWGGLALLALGSFWNTIPALRGSRQDQTPAG